MELRRLNLERAKAYENPADRHKRYLATATACLLAATLLLLIPTLLHTTTPNKLVSQYQPNNPKPSTPTNGATIARLDDASCGDGVCQPNESPSTCMADCPGVTTPPQCGEEPHSDPGGYAVVWGAAHKTDSAAGCCEACARHAADPKNAKKPCNSWVFCHTRPQCWSLDTGNWHGFGECWLKWQADTRNPLYGQRGKYTDGFRRRYHMAHKTGHNPDGSPRNLSVPTHVPWTGGVMGVRYDASVKWETGVDGMRSSKGETTVQWRAWESREENLRRGVDPKLLEGF